MKANNETFVQLDNICSKATQTTVNLYNTCLYIYEDKGGKYVNRAVRPHENGVIVQKQYINK